MDEFRFIEKLLAPLAGKEALSLKDDAALLRIPQGQELVLTKDALVEGVHFTGAESAALIARKLLRVNLSDLAAMGATPKAYLLALMLPRTLKGRWLSGFAAGLKADQTRYGITLLGGDTTRTNGPLSFSLTALGLVPQGQALKRSGAKPGDRIYVSGTLGDAALGLQHSDSHLKRRYQLPEPRVALGQKLRGIASAAIDISDGLMQDLSHICATSGVGAAVHWEAMPLSAQARRALKKHRQPYEIVVAGGDDYELLFTVPPKAEARLAAAARAAKTPITPIGVIRKSGGVKLLNAQGKSIALSRLGYLHF